jgi:hypothetical protein
LAILKLKNHLNTLTINEKEFEFNDQFFQVRPKESQKVFSYHMDTDAKDRAKTTKDKVKAASLIEQAPIVIDINRRYYKFYDKPSETVTGGGLERSRKLGSDHGERLQETGVGPR